MATSSEAIVAQKGPSAAELRAGRIDAWRACGRGSTQPLRAGSHKSTGLTPMVFKAEGTAYLCGCKTNRGRSFCDGSHNRL